MIYLVPGIIPVSVYLVQTAVIWKNRATRKEAGVAGNFEELQ